MIYLDYQATTPVAPEVIEAMTPWIADKFANPHSPSRWGREAAAAIEMSRKQIDDALGHPEGTVAFTGGATEALNWALKGSIERAAPDRRRIITLATEHAAVLDTCEWLSAQGVDLTLLPVRRDGLLDLELLRRELDESVALVAVMLVNNEIGVIQPIAEIAAMAHDVGALMLCDAVQGFGRIEVPQGPDLIALSAHKIHGPKGIGALWMRQGCEPLPMIHGGGQEKGLRSGTLSPELCVGFGAAAKLSQAGRDEDQVHVQKLWTAATEVFGDGWTINGSTSKRYRGNLNIRREGVDAARIIGDLRDIAFSLGSACASGSGRPSHVLRALGLNGSQARSSIRLGFGRYSTDAELVEACERIVASAASQDILRL